MNIDEEINKAVEFLRKGKTILYPTDTIWGLGCDATNQKAVSRIFKIKKRIEGRSMIVLLDHQDRLTDYVEKVPSIAYELMLNIKSPLTIIYPGGKKLAKNIIAEDGTVAIRIARDEFCQRLVASFGVPVVSTSANISGEPTPLVFNQITNSVKDAVDYIVDYDRDKLRSAKASTLIKVHLNGEFEVLRK